MLTSPLLAALAIAALLTAGLLLIGRVSAAIVPLSPRRVPGAIRWSWRRGAAFSAGLALVVAGYYLVTRSAPPAIALPVAAWLGAIAAPWFYEAAMWAYLGPDVVRANAETFQKGRLTLSFPLYALSGKAFVAALMIAAGS
jgi:hypothetical protein